jgi:peptide/nickel transport system permease protein
MASVILRRLIQGLVTVFIVTTLTFLLIHAAPGEPFAGVLGDPRVTPALRAAWRAQYGLDQPLLTQYGHFLGNVARADLGISFTYQRPVGEVLAAAIPSTLLLMLAALAIAFGGGIALGATQAAGAGRWFDRLTGGGTVVVAALPDFWLAMVVLFFFALRWQVAPAGGMVDQVMHDSYSPWGRALDVLRHLALPAATLGVIVGAALARYQRAALLEALPDEYVRTARAKGVSRRRVVYYHALRNALLPTITLFGLAIPALLGGAVFIEAIFAWPGMGRLAVDAVANRDYPLVLATTMAGSLFVVAGGILADILYAVADPRLRRA